MEQQTFVTSNSEGGIGTASVSLSTPQLTERILKSNGLIKNN